MKRSPLLLASLPALLAAGLLAAGAVFAASKPGSDPVEPPARAKAADKGGAPDAPLVHLVRPEKGGLDRVSRQSCTAEPVQQVDLTPGVAGVIERVNVDLGDRVKAGQLLATNESPAVLRSAPSKRRMSSLKRLSKCGR